MKLYSKHNAAIDWGFAIQLPGTVLDVPKDYEVRVRKSSVFEAGFVVDKEPTPVEVANAPPIPAVTSILNMDPAAAIVAIGGCLNRRQLNDWASVETRPIVMAALQKQTLLARE